MTPKLHLVSNAGHSDRYAWSPGGGNHQITIPTLACLLHVGMYVLGMSPLPTFSLLLGGLDLSHPPLCS